MSPHDICTSNFMPWFDSSRLLEVLAEHPRTSVNRPRKSNSRYSQTSLIRTSKGQNQVSFLQRCPYYRGRECMMFGISGTKRAVRNRKVSVL